MGVLLVGIAGGTGSGKTTLAASLARAVGSEKVGVVPLDAYYRDRSHLTRDERRTLNYDHPSAIEHDLLLRHLQELRRGNAIDIPLYDYGRAVRLSETTPMMPRPCIIVEGLFALAIQPLRKSLDLSVFLEANAEVRRERVFRRELRERRWAPEALRNAWQTTIQPMYSQFIEPSRQHAQIVIDGNGFDPGATDGLAAEIARMLAARPWSLP